MTVVRNATTCKYLLFGLVILMTTSTFAASNLYSFTLPNIDGKPMPLADFKGKVILMVNVASQCGFTPQFKGLEALYQKYKDRNFVILGFPSADFHQEFADEQKTSEVCYQNYGVTFPMFKASPVRGDDANAFFKKLSERSGTTPKWNFYKYLIDKQGNVVESFASPTTPEDRELNQKIDALLKKP